MTNFVRLAPEEQQTKHKLLVATQMSGAMDPHISYKGRSDAGATIPHGRAGLTPKLKNSFAKSADEGGRTVRRISVPTFPPHKKITSEASTFI